MEHGSRLQMRCRRLTRAGRALPHARALRRERWAAQAATSGACVRRRAALSRLNAPVFLMRR